MGGSDMGVSLKESLRRQILLGDGAMGTTLQSLLKKAVKGPYELLSLKQPALIEKIHCDFLQAGSDIIETNTFGGSGLSLREYGLESRTSEINKAAAALARKAADSFSGSDRPRFVAGSVGPTKYLPSLGQISFDSLYTGYKAQCSGLIRGGVDFVLIETAQDLLQVKAALLAARDAAEEAGKEIPVAVSLSQENGRLLTGTDIEAAAVVLEPFELLYLGLNCGNGFEGLEESLQTLNRFSPFPLALMPNAGFPEVRNGQLHYSMTPEEFAREFSRLLDLVPLSLAGGCCGTTPAHLKALRKEIDGRLFSSRPDHIRRAHLASLYKAAEVRTSRPPFIIGERANTQGSRKFKELLLKNDFESMVAIALEQERAGAGALDLCSVIPGRDEVQDLSLLTEELNRQAKTPLCLDTVNAEALEEALKRVSGKPLINSVHLKDDKQARKVFSLADRFGAALICLAIDEHGMALSSEEKIRKAERIYSLAVEDYGFAPEDLFFDMLTFTIASDTDKNSAYETLKALRKFKERHPRVNTVLGISNISHGLHPFPRKILNSLFLQLAVEHGLDASLVHAGNLTPLHHFPEELIKLGRHLLSSPVPDAEGLTDFLKLCEKETAQSVREEIKEEKELTLLQAIIDGRKEDALRLAKKGLEEYGAEILMEKSIIPAMEEVGRLFESGRLQLPFVLRSSETAKKTLDLLSQHLSSPTKRGTILMATVHGDVHDIGKNLSALIFRNHGYQVFDLGVDRSAEEIVGKIKDHRPDAVGLSGLLATSALYFGTVLSLLEKEGIRIPVLCGGAALTRDFTQNHLAPLYSGSVYKADDAFDAIRFLRKHPVTQIPDLCEKTFSEKYEQKNTCSQVPDPGEIHQVHFSIETLLPFLNRNRLFKVRWGGFEPHQGEEELARLLLKKNLYRGIKGVYASFPCIRDQETLTLLNPEGESLTTFRFPRDTGGTKRCITDFFREEGDHITLFLVTAGPDIAYEEIRLMENDSYYDYYLLHGLGTELAEAAAACLNNEISKKEGAALRFGFGYPVCPDLKYQETLCRLLQAGTIGVSVTASFQLVPELSTGGFMIHNKNACYFPMKGKGGLQ